MASLWYSTGCYALVYVRKSSVFVRSAFTALSGPVVLLCLIVGGLLRPALAHELQGLTQDADHLAQHESLDEAQQQDLIQAADGFDPGALNIGGKACLAAPGTHQHCSHVFACMGEEGEYFWGQARGWGEIGLLRGKTSVAHCSGFWQRGDLVGMGKARINCSDGIFAEVVWNKVLKQDLPPSSSPSFQGTGRDSLGRGVVAWTGAAALAQLKEAKGAGDAALLRPAQPVAEKSADPDVLQANMQASDKIGDQANAGESTAQSAEDRAMRNLTGYCAAAVSAHVSAQGKIPTVNNTSETPVIDGSAKLINPQD